MNGDASKRNVRRDAKPTGAGPRQVRPAYPLPNVDHFGTTDPRHVSVGSHPDEPGGCPHARGHPKAETASLVTGVYPVSHPCEARKIYCVDYVGWHCHCTIGSAVRSGGATSVYSQTLSAPELRLRRARRIILPFPVFFSSYPRVVFWPSIRRDRAW